MIRWIIIVVLILAIGLISYGFIAYSGNHPKSNFYMGLGTVVFFLVFIPLFLFYRRKKLTADKYLLNRDTFKKMQEHEKNKKN